MQFPRIYFPDKETAEKVLDLSDPCGGRLYVSTFVNLAYMYLREKRGFIPRSQQIYDEFFITQKEYDNARIILDKRTGCYRIDFQVDNCYWDDRVLIRGRGGSPGCGPMIDDVAIELSIHRRVEDRVMWARAAAPQIYHHHRCEPCDYSHEPLVYGEASYENYPLTSEDYDDGDFGLD